MKTTVNVYVSGLEATRNFESNVAKEINSKLLEYGQEPADIVEINSAGMSWEGRGQFKKIVELTIEGQEYNLSIHSTDSQLYDEIKDNDNPTAYSKLLKRLVLDVLSAKNETIAEEVMENRAENEVIYKITKHDEKGNEGWVFFPNTERATEFDNLKEAYKAYTEAEKTEEDNERGYDIELTKYYKLSGEIADWTDRELDAIGEPRNGWVIK